MLSFNQDTDDFRPKNRVKTVQEVDIVKTLPTFTIEDVLEKVQKTCKQKNIRIEEFMRDCDKHRNGSISFTQFLSCLAMLKLFLSRDESDLLTEHYKNPEKPKEVLWKLFCDEVDLVFGIKKLEKRDDIIDLSNTAKNSFNANELSLLDEAYLQELLRKMQAFFEVKRIDPKPIFLNFDQLKRGKVLKHQFKKILNSQKLVIEDSEVELLMKKYGDAVSNEINYVLILNEIKDESGILPEIGEKPEFNAVPSLSSANNYYTYKTHFGNLNFSKDAHEAIEKIKNKVKTNRIRLGQFFVDYDNLRKGYVNKAKFRTALDMACVGLNNEEYKYLEEAFLDQTDANRVVYKALVEEVEKVFTFKNMEKNPLERPNEYSIPEFLDPTKRLTEQENELLHEVMKKLGDLMLKYRVIPKSYFRDSDRANCGVIPSSKFSSYLSFLKLEVSEVEMNILIKRFHAKTNIEINYYDFDQVLSYYVKMISDE